jgi:hypothetical protein
MSDTRYATCSACALRVICRSQDIYPDNGWVLPFDAFGYYGGFDDNIGITLGGTRSREWILCHDCVVKLLELFPRLSETIGANAHPCSSDTPCCRHAWQATEIFGKNVHGVHSRTAWPDGVWHDTEPENPFDRYDNE